MDDTGLLSERIELAALEAIHRAAPEALRRELGLHLERIGGATLSACTGDPTTLLNRTLGLGVEAPARRASLDAVVARYRELGIDRYYLHLHPEARPSELRAWVRASGLERGRGWMKFRRGAGAPPPARGELSIRRVGDDQAEPFARIVAEGFGMRDFRRRGAQGKLIERRIRDALDLGCTALFTETGEAVEREPQHSYGNIPRYGFEPAHLRDNFVPRNRC